METFQLGLLLSTLIESMAVNAEIEAMKAANKRTELIGGIPQHGEADFKEKADYLWALATQAQMQVR